MLRFRSFLVLLALVPLVLPAQRYTPMPAATVKAWCAEDTLRAEPKTFVIGPELLVAGPGRQYRAISCGRGVARDVTRDAATRWAVSETGGRVTVDPTTGYVFTGLGPVVRVHVYACYPAPERRQNWWKTVRYCTPPAPPAALVGVDTTR